MLLKLLAFRICDSKISGNIVSQVVEDIFFLEDLSPPPFLERAKKLVLYHWNRVYPGDVRIALPPPGWKLEEQTDFPGYSHDKITREVYTR